MNIMEFHQLPQYDNMLEAKNLKVGDRFLTGRNVIEQVNSKKVGEVVTYYEVVSVGRGGSLAYAFKTEKLTGMNEEDNTR